VTTTESTLIEEAREALSKGDVGRARRLLRRVVQQEPDNHKAWLWLAGVTDAPRASIQYVKRAEELQPEDPAVISAMAWAQQRVNESVSGQPDKVRIVAESVPVATLHRPITISTPPETTAEEDVSIDKLSDMLRRVGFVLLVIVALLLIAFVLFSISSPSASSAGLEQPVAAQIFALNSQSTLPDIQPAIIEPQPTLDIVATQQAQARAGLFPKRVKLSAEPLPAWTLTPSPTPLPTATPLPTPVPLPTATPAISGGANASFSDWRWIDVNLSTQQLTAYQNNVPVMQTYISSGAWGMETVTGVFRIYLRYEIQHMTGYHLGYDYSTPDVPYVQYFHGNYGLHGAYWHNSFGTPVSHGCVNMTVSDAQWLWNFADYGTLVNVHY
jgi:lipoprotein-anchoring transpeptidase ErfK/SrfK